MQLLTGALDFRAAETIGVVKSIEKQSWLARPMEQPPNHLYVFNNYSLCDDNLRLSDVQAQKSCNMRIVYGVSVAALKPTTSVYIQADRIGRFIPLAVELPCQFSNIPVQFLLG